MVVAWNGYQLDITLLSKVHSKAPSIDRPGTSVRQLMVTASIHPFCIASGWRKQQGQQAGSARKENHQASTASRAPVHSLAWFKYELAY